MLKKKLKIKFFFSCLQRQSDTTNAIHSRRNQNLVRAIRSYYENLCATSYPNFNFFQGCSIPQAARTLREIRRARVYGKLAATGQILWLSRRQFTAAAGRQRLSETEDWLPTTTSSRLPVAERFPVRFGFSRVPLHAVHPTFVGSVLHTGTGLLPRIARSYAATGECKFRSIFTGNWSRFVGRIR